VKRLLVAFILLLHILSPRWVYPEGKGKLSLLWSYFAFGNICYPPTIDAYNNLYFTSRGARLYALSKGGKELWSYENDCEFATPVVIGFDGSIVLGDVEGNILCFYPNGERRWEVAVRDIPKRIALGFNGYFYVITGTTLYAISYFGTLRWKYQFGSPVTAPPLVTEDGDVVVATERALYLIGANGENRWKIAAGFVPRVCIGGMERRIYAGGAGKIVGIDARGELLWEYFVGERIIGLLGDKRGMIFGVTERGDLYVVNKRGTLIGKWAIGVEGIRGVDTLIFAKEGSARYLLILHSDRYVVFVFIDSGNLGKDRIKIYKFHMNEQINAVMMMDHALYISFGDWSLRKFSLSDGIWNSYLRNSFHISQVGVVRGDRISGVCLGLMASVKSNSPKLSMRALRSIKNYLGGRVFIPLYAGEIEEICGYVLGSEEKSWVTLKLSAIELLGKLKTRGAEVILERFVLNENNTDLIVACVEALGEIGFDPYGDVFGTFLELSRHYGSNGSVMRAIVKGLGRMVHLNGIRKSKNAISLLIRISCGPYGREVRNAARKLLQQILKEKI